jgi:hypothetical protein
MKVTHKSLRPHSRHSELDLETIRRRVADIKQHWTPEIAQARALEGARRRRALDALVTELIISGALGDAAEQMVDEECGHDLSLVG